MNIPWWAVPLIVLYFTWLAIRKHTMKVLLVLVIIAGMIYWNKTRDTEPSVAKPAAAVHEPTYVESVTQWIVDHTPKK